MKRNILDWPKGCGTLLMVFLPLLLVSFVANSATVVLCTPLGVSFTRVAAAELRVAPMFAVIALFGTFTYFANTEERPPDYEPRSLFLLPAITALATVVMCSLIISTSAFSLNREWVFPLIVAGMISSPPVFLCAVLANPRCGRPVAKALAVVLSLSVSFGIFGVLAFSLGH